MAARLPPHTHHRPSPALDSGFLQIWSPNTGQTFQPWALSRRLRLLRHRERINHGPLDPARHRLSRCQGNSQSGRGNMLLWVPLWPDPSGFKQCCDWLLVLGGGDRVGLKGGGWSPLFEPRIIALSHRGGWNGAKMSGCHSNQIQATMKGCIYSNYPKAYSL